ncbi:hypothetical protein [Embleya sp. NPDC005575]|uniref:hypothetical protein n=1 Tax=Embleya sp. NPDC005575 TaxID=3156892 RepID=UPI0033A63D93
MRGKLSVLFRKRVFVAVSVVCLSLLATGLVLGRNGDLPWQKEDDAAPKRVCFDALSGAEVTRFVSGSTTGKHGSIRNGESREPVSATFTGQVGCYVTVPTAAGAVRPQNTFISHPDGNDRAAFEFKMPVVTSLESMTWQNFPSGATPLGGGLSGAVADNAAWVRVPRCENAPANLRDVPQFAMLSMLRSADAPSNDVRPMVASMLTRLVNRSLEAIGCRERIPDLDISSGPVRRTPLAHDGACLPISAGELGISDTTGWTRESFTTAPDILSWCDVFNEKGERALRFTKVHRLLAGPLAQPSQRFANGKILEWGCESVSSLRDYDTPVRGLERLDDRLRSLDELKAAIVAAAPEPAACAVPAK